MRKYLLSLIIVLPIAFTSNSQVEKASVKSFRLTKGEWEFHVHDTLQEPYTTGHFQGTYKFKKFGKLKVKDKEQSGKWSLNGDVLTIDMDDYENATMPPKSIKIIVINPETFYSPQLDNKTTYYWIFKRKSS